MAFGDRSQTGGGKPRRKPSPRTRVPATPLVLAPKPTGVFADTRVRAQTPVSGADRARARRRTQRAEDRLPGTTVPVKRLPILANPTRKQAQAIVAAQRRALAHTPIRAKIDAAANGDAVSRAQLGQALRAADRLAHDHLVRIGVDEVRRRGVQVRYPDAPGLSAPNTLHDVLPAKIRGRLPRGPRDALATIGAARLLAADPNPRAKVRAPHGFNSGASALGSAVVHLSPGTAVKGASIVAQATAHAANKAAAHVFRDAEAFKDDNVLINLGKDVVRFPYDSVNSGVHVADAGLDLLAKSGPVGKAAAVLTTGPLGTAAVYGARGRKGGTAKARALVSTLDDGVIGALAAGDFKLALHRFEQHPLYGTTEFTGAYGALGRTLGAAARLGGELGSARLARVGSTKRAPLRASRHSNVSENRSHSRNLLTALAQKELDRRKVARGQDPNIAEPGRAEKMLQRAAHEDAAFYQDLARTDREDARHEGQQAVRGRRGPATGVEKVLRDSVGAATQGKLGSLADRADLADRMAAERARLARAYEDHYASMDLQGRTENLRQQGQLKAAEAIIRGKKGEAAAADLLDRSVRYRQAANSRTQRLVDLKALDPDQAAAAQLRPFAVTSMDLKFDPKLARTDDVQAAIDAAHGNRRAAKVSLRLADEAVTNAKVALGQASTRQRARAGQRRAKIVKPGESLGATRGERVTAYIDRVMAAADNGDRPAVLRMARQEAKDARQVKAARVALKNAKVARKAAKQTLAGVKIPKGRKFPTGLVDAQGKRVTLGPIRAAHAAEQGGDLPAFVSHDPALTSTRANFRNFISRNGPARVRVDVRGRTGESVRMGQDPSSGRHLVDSLVNTQGAISAIENHDRFISRFGSGDRNGKPFTPERALEEIKARSEGENALTPDVPWVAVPAAPRGYTTDRIDQIGRLQDPAAGGEPMGMIRDQMREIDARELQAMAAGHAPKQNVVLVPKAALDEFEALQKPTESELAKGMQAFTNVFRQTVLPTSTKWLWGNTAEMALRLALEHGPTLTVDFVHGHRLAKAIRDEDPMLWRELESRVLGGLHFASVDRLKIYRSADMFKGKVTRPIAKALALGRHAPIVQQVVDGYMLYAKGVIKLNRALERSGQYAVLGKVARRQAQELTGSWSKALVLQGKTFDAIARGAEADITRFSIAAARQMDDVLGKYTRFGPRMRKFTQTVAPFLPWYLNAAKFVYYTLPIKHPLKGAVLGLVERAFDADQEKHNESLFSGDNGSLAADPQRSDGGIVPISRYTPAGAFTPVGRNADHVFESAMDPIFPQFSTPFTIALFAENFAHRPLQLSSGEQDPAEWKKGLLALYSGFESVVPFTQIARRIMEHGDTGYDDSTVVSPKRKPGTSFGRTALERIFVPWTPTYLHGPQVATKPRAQRPVSESDALLNAIDSQDGGASADQDVDALLKAIEAQGG